MYNKSTKTKIPFLISRHRFRFSFDTNAAFDHQLMKSLLGKPYLFDQKKLSIWFCAHSLLFFSLHLLLPSTSHKYIHVHCMTLWSNGNNRYRLTLISVICCYIEFVIVWFTSNVYLWIYKQSMCAHRHASQRAILVTP